jgi:hypothetical protein
MKLPNLDNILKMLEFSSVLVVTFLLWLTVGLLIIWVLFGVGFYQKGRMDGVLIHLNANWKLGLLLMVPLFYRTVRDVLERIEHGPWQTTFPKKPAWPTPDETEEEKPGGLK